MDNDTGLQLDLDLRTPHCTDCPIRGRRTGAGDREGRHWISIYLQLYVI